MQYIATYNSSLSHWKSFFYHLTARRLFFLFTALFLILLFLYMYLINATVRNVVQYGQLEAQNSALSVQVDSLQSNYIAEKSAISLSVAYNEGYQDARSPQFISSAVPVGPSVALSYKYP